MKTFIGIRKETGERVRVRHWDRGDMRGGVAVSDWTSAIHIEGQRPFYVRVPKIECDPTNPAVTREQRDIAAIKARGVELVRDGAGYLEAEE